jgi:hypothetical protein
MQKIQAHHSKDYTYPHAYDEFNNFVKREDAIYDKRKYYKYPNKGIELIYYPYEKDVYCWRAKPNQFITLNDGKKYYFTEFEKKINESYEHKSFKSSIIEKGFFEYKTKKVLIKEAKEECIIEDSKFRSDVSGYLLDGTPCIIEVIKTSDFSVSKFNHIEDKQILTFKIYIDEYGNQITPRDYIVGNEEIKRIKESIHNGEGKFAELRERNDEIRKKSKIESFDRIQRFQDFLYERKQIFSEQVRKIKERCDTITNGATGEIESFEKQIDSIGKRIRNVLSQIREYEDKFTKINEDIARGKEGIFKQSTFNERFRAEIKEQEKVNSGLESEFIKIAKGCKVKWYAPDYIKEPTDAEKIKELKYWTS